MEFVLSEKPVLVVFDGLDEVSTALRPLAQQMIQALSKIYPTIQRIVITCRTRTYEKEGILSGFTPYQLRPLTTAKIMSFVEAWVHQKRIEPEHSKIKPSLEYDHLLSPMLQDLGENPLLLQTVVAFYQHNDSRSSSHTLSLIHI